VAKVRRTSLRAYRTALSLGIAKEVARVLLPEGLVPSRMYVNGTVRSWIHYINLRSGPETQKEHREVAEQAKKIFVSELPRLSAVLGWTSE
jgi:thymidylate synthase (FAD)